MSKQTVEINRDIVTTQEDVTATKRTQNLYDVDNDWNPVLVATAEETQYDDTVKKFSVKRVDDDAHRAWATGSNFEGVDYAQVLMPVHDITGFQMLDRRYTQNSMVQRVTLDAGGIMQDIFSYDEPYWKDRYEKAQQEALRYERATGRTGTMRTVLDITVSLRYGYALKGALRTRREICTNGMLADVFHFADFSMNHTNWNPETLANWLRHIRDGMPGLMATHDYDKEGFEEAFGGASVNFYPPAQLPDGSGTEDDPYIMDSHFKSNPVGGFNSINLVTNTMRQIVQRRENGDDFRDLESYLHEVPAQSLKPFTRLPRNTQHYVINQLELLRDEGPQDDDVLYSAAIQNALTSAVSDSLIDDNDRDLIRLEDNHISPLIRGVTAIAGIQQWIDQIS